MNGIGDIHRTAAVIIEEGLVALFLQSIYSARQADAVGLEKESKQDHRIGNAESSILVEVSSQLQPACGLRLTTGVDPWSSQGKLTGAPGGSLTETLNRGIWIDIDH